jgi:hypothetical protein
VNKVFGIIGVVVSLAIVAVLTLVAADKQAGPELDTLPDSARLGIAEQTANAIARNATFLAAQGRQDALAISVKETGSATLVGDDVVDINGYLFSFTATGSSFAAELLTDEEYAELAAVRAQAAETSARSIAQYANTYMVLTSGLSVADAIAAAAEDSVLRGELVDGRYVESGYVFEFVVAAAADTITTRPVS